MNVDQFLDVNGFNREYNMPLEKRLNKYRTHDIQDSSRPIISDADIRAFRAARYAAAMRKRQVITSIAALVGAGAIIFASYCLTYGWPF